MQVCPFLLQTDKRIATALLLTASLEIHFHRFVCYILATRSGLIRPSLRYIYIYSLSSIHVYLCFNLTFLFVPFMQAVGEAE